MAAISSLQVAQYGVDFATNDAVEVDYVAWAGAVSGVLALPGGYTVSELRAAMTAALTYDGLAVVHVPVYFGPDELGGLGAYGDWNVGNWVAATQQRRHDIGLESQQSRTPTCTPAPRNPGKEAGDDHDRKPAGADPAVR